MPRLPTVDWPLASVDELQVLPPEEARHAVLLGMMHLAASVMQVDLKSVIVDANAAAGEVLATFGMDSMMGMELRSRIAAWVGVDVAPHVLIGDRLSHVVKEIHDALQARCPAPRVAKQEIEMQVIEL